MPQNQARAASSRGASLIKQKILFVSGKGGVGKSAIAAAIARAEAEAGRRVLLVEIGDNSYYKDFFGLDQVGSEPREVPGQAFDLAMWNGENCLREYVLFYLRLERIYHVFFENRVMRAFINVAPGLNEIAILGKITSGIRKIGPSLDYDLIVVDSYATGHTLALLGAPKGLKEAIKFGPMGQQSGEIDEILRNPALCAYWVVTLLEEMPVVETLEFRETLKSEFGIECDVIANKVLRPPVGAKELKDLSEKGPADLGEFARYLRSIEGRQEHFLKVLRDNGLKPRVIPFILSADSGRVLKEAEEALRKT